MQKLSVGPLNPSHEKVIKLFKKAKKTSSRVPGDINSRLYDMYPLQLSTPVVKIFNAVLAQAKWPSLWAVEYVTIIPKCPVPASPADFRNISCTNFLSKILDWRKQGKKFNQGLNQYGGEPGASAVHLLPDQWGYEDLMGQVMDVFTDTDSYLVDALNWSSVGTTTGVGCFSVKTGNPDHIQDLRGVVRSIMFQGQCYETFPKKAMMQSFSLSAFFPRSTAFVGIGKLIEWLLFCNKPTPILL